MLLKRQRIDDLYKILVFFEKVEDPNSKIDKESYLKYLDKLYVVYRGYDNEKIYEPINGLRKLGMDIEHDLVRSIVFDMIKVIEMEG